MLIPAKAPELCEVCGEVEPIEGPLHGNSENRGGEERADSVLNHSEKRVQAEAVQAIKNQRGARVLPLLKDVHEPRQQGGLHREFSPVLRGVVLGELGILRARARPVPPQGGHRQEQHDEEDGPTRRDLEKRTAIADEGDHLECAPPGVLSR